MSGDDRDPDVEELLEAIVSWDPSQEERFRRETNEALEDAILRLLLVIQVRQENLDEDRKVLNELLNELRELRHGEG